MKSIFTVLFILTALITDASAQAGGKYMLYLTDKNNSPYSVSRPSEFLSERAIQRRERQHIPVRLNDLPVNPSYIAAIAGTGAQILYPSKWLNAVVAEINDETILNAISSLPFVIKTVLLQNNSPQQQLHTRHHEKLESAVELRTTALPYNYGPSYRQINMIGGDQLHNLGFKGSGMVIAVLDAGFLNVHIHQNFDSLRASGRILGTRDFVTNDNDVYSDHSHGAMVLSTMAGNTPGQLVGTAPHASYWLIRTEDAATETLAEESNWVRGAEFADSVGADIINSSLGYTTFDIPSQNHTYQDMDGNTTIITKGADAAASKGILVVNSAGNEGGGSWKFIGAPADGDSVLTVGAVDSTKVIAFFSSRGPSSDGRVKPNVCAMGVAAVLASPGGGFQRGNGTSFSGPIIAGMAACLWQTNTSKSNMEVYDAIQRSADRYNTPDDDYGYGIPNFSLANLLLSGIDVNRSSNTYISLYPNPFEDHVSYVLYSHDSDDVMLEVFDLKGTRVLGKELSIAGNSYHSGSLEFNTELAPGMYLLRLKSSSSSSVTKLIRR